MQHLVYETKDLQQQGATLITADGLVLEESAVKEALKYNNLPETLLSVDKKYGLDTTRQLLVKQVPEISILLEERGEKKEIQVLDSKSHYVGDEEYAKAVEIVRDIVGAEPVDTWSYRFGSKTSFRISADSDSFVKDAYHKHFDVTRLPQGGLLFSVGLLRLACTNGMLAKDKELQHLMRQGRYDESVVVAFANRVREMNLDTYFRSLFMHGGEYIQASVADYLSMKGTLAQITDEDYADLLYPVDPIKQFYADQNINISELSRQNLHRLPSGIRYYDAFNILTNGAKMAEPTLSNQIMIAAYSTNAKLRQLKDSDITFHGAPHFDPTLIARRMGDIKD